MPDHAISTDPAVQCQLDRLTLLSPGADILGLGRITELLDRVGNPHRSLPPVFHVAGTNGKGSTCAFLRAAIEATGLSVHVYSSPHLVRFNERIRIAGSLIADAILAPLLEEVLDAGGDIGASFFEVTTAAAFLAFSRTPADACVIEVGLGGRLDATNVVQPAGTAIAQLGIDHQGFLGDTILDIAGEKAGIAKPGVPLVTMRYTDDVATKVAQIAVSAGASVMREGDAWRWSVEDGRLHYSDARGEVETPLPALAGPHQPANLALAIALLRAQTSLAIPDSAYTAAARNARWPARMQLLSDGPLTAMLPDDAQLWLDGGHNPAAAAVVTQALANASITPSGYPLPRHLIIGMLSNKDPEGLLAPFASQVDTLVAVPVPGHEHHAPFEIAKIAHRLGICTVGTASDIPTALATVARHSDPRGMPPVVLILGSLYLAGTVLAANGELPN